MTEHDLKCWPEFFAAILDGTKQFELRFNDRGYAVGDTLRLREWEPGTEQYTGREARRTVSYMLEHRAGASCAANLGLGHGHVLMSLAPTTLTPNR